MITIQTKIKPCAKCNLLYSDTYTAILYNNSNISHYNKTKIYNDIVNLFLSSKNIIFFQPVKVAKFRLIFEDGFCNHTIISFIEDIFDILLEFSKILQVNVNELFSNDIDWD
jgi:hypothetical protein